MNIALNHERVLIQKTRADALACGDLTFFPAEPCARGHRSTRYAIDGSCLECQRADRNAKSEAEKYHRKALKAVSESIEERELKQALAEVWE